MKYTTDPERLAEEIEIEFYKSSGPGGQHKNKRETAVRMHHLPSGITVTCSDERSQSANREIALQRLIERLRILNRPRKRRRKTKPTRASRERRLEKKKQQSEKKKRRNYRWKE